MKDIVKMGEFIRQFRQVAGMSRTALAKQVGVSNTYMWMLEGAHPRASGEPSQPGKAVLQQIAAVLQMTADQTYELLRLAGYDNDPPKPVDTSDVFSIEISQAEAQFLVEASRAAVQMLTEIRDSPGGLLLEADQINQKRTLGLFLGDRINRKIWESHAKEVIA